jgi:hypothetical protein
LKAYPFPPNNCFSTALRQFRDHPVINVLKYDQLLDTL